MLEQQEKVNSKIWPLPMFQGLSLKNLLLYSLQNCKEEKASHEFMKQKRHEKSGLTAHKGQNREKQVPKDICASHYKLPREHLEYICYICAVKSYSMSSLEGCLDLSSRYLHKATQLQSLQLVLIVSLMLVTKINDPEPMRISELHELCNHSVTSRDALSLEHRICETLDFQIQKSSPVCWKMSIAVEMVCETVEKQHKESLMETLTAVSRLFWIEVYSRGRDRLIEALFQDQGLMICLILKMAFTTQTQCEGLFPQIEWLQSILETDKKELDFAFQVCFPLLLGEHKDQFL